VYEVWFQCKRQALQEGMPSAGLPGEEEGSEAKRPSEVSTAVAEEVELGVEASSFAAEGFES
jgi:hypothetical protein